MALSTAPGQETTLEIIAFHLGAQYFCIKTTAIREIRAWGRGNAAAPSPPHVLGVMNVCGSVIPIIDLAARLGVHGSVDTNRSAIVVAKVG